MQSLVSEVRRTWVIGNLEYVGLSEIVLSYAVMTVGFRDRTDICYER